MTLSIMTLRWCYAVSCMVAVVSWSFILNVIFMNIILLSVVAPTSNSTCSKLLSLAVTSTLFSHLQAKQVAYT
jgi:hypothetical protein